MTDFHYACIFFIVGFFAATGIPLMALAMANIASMLITVGDPDEAEKIIAAKVTLKELRMMQKFELDDGDGEISRAEYILLCTVRLGALSPDLIGKINERYKILDSNGDGSLSYAEILEHPEGTVVNVLHPTDLAEEDEEAMNSSVGGSAKGYAAVLQAPVQLVRRLSSFKFGSQEKFVELADAADNV